MIRPDYFFYVLGLSELGLALFKRAGSSTQNKDQGSLGGLWGIIGAAIFCAIFISFTFHSFALPFSNSVYWMAMLLFIGGTALRWWSIIHLGRFFTVNVAIAQDHRVVDDGPYRHVRHPSYSGVFLAFTGLGLMLFNWLSFIVLLAPIVVMFLWRMNIEEKALCDALGQPYIAYMQRTKRIIPWLY
jgi:protein-S-isoprenylcysteine O-methyltransferase